jgi:thymidylate synthase ThyX
MAFAAKVVLDSINSDRQRLVSVLATYPRFIHAEIMTHRDRARNAASSRAIPWKSKRKKMVNETQAEYLMNTSDDVGLVAFSEKCMFRMIQDDPVIPIKWGCEQKGMQTGDEIPPEDQVKAREIWLKAMQNAVEAADQLSQLNVHKSLCNRITEPWMWITVLMSATEWKNFFRLRCHPDAEIHFQRIAGMIRDAMAASEPRKLGMFEWHTPFVDDEEKKEIEGAWRNARLNVPIEMSATECIKRISAGRCARLSYLTHDGKRDWNEDIGLATRLICRPDDVIHASPLEHVARASDKNMRSGPFKGWFQYRKEFANENVEG